MIYRAISADSHVNEPPDLFVKRVPEKLRDRAPKIIELDNGGQAWAMEGLPDPISFALTAVNVRAQSRFDRANYKAKFMEARDGIQKGVRYEDILPGSWDPVARLKEQDEDNCDAEVMYASPQVWGGVKAMADKELQLACFRAYNDWMAEYCSHSPLRLIGVGLVPTTGIDDAIAEMKRCLIDLNLPTVALESYPSGSYLGPTPEDDRFWAVAEEIGKPISLHFSIKVPANATQAFAKGGDEIRRAVAGGTFQTVMQKLILDGTFDRHPTIKFIGAEVNCGWLPHYFDRFDATYKRNWRTLPKRLDMLPSEYFARNIWVTYIIDQIGVNNRYAVPGGVDRLMWSSDFPHSVSSWPIDVELAEAQLINAEVPEDEWQRMMWRNCADMYKLPYEIPQVAQRRTAEQAA